MSGLGFYSLPSNATSGVSVLSQTNPQTVPQEYSVHHETYFSMYGVDNSTTSTIFYVSVGITYANSSFVFPSNPDAEFNITAQGHLTFDTLSLSGGSVSGTASVGISGGGEFTIQSPPQLIGVTVDQNGTSQEIWSGYLSTSNTVSGYAYYNSELGGNVTLEYASGYTTKNFTIQFSPTVVSYSKSIVGVTSLQSTFNLTTTSSFTVPLHFPERYHPVSSQLDLNQFNFKKIFEAESNSSNFSYNIQASENNATSAYLNSTLYPALVWKMNGNIDGNSSMLSRNSTVSIPFGAEAVAFYGINGEKAGYVLSLYADGSVSSVAPLESLKLGFVASSITTVVGKNIAPAGSLVSQSSLKIDNSSVVVFLTSNGEVESTANVTFSRSVSEQSSGSLVQLQVNSTTSYYAIFSDGSSGDVGVVTPSSDSNSSFTINGTAHVAQLLTVNGTGYILINATTSGSLTGSIAVYKQTAQGSVLLSPQDYFVSNGHIQIFDDPSSTYYVVYSQTIPGSNNSLYLISGAVVIIAALLAAVLVIRKRKPTS